jgi:hypothetical protein
MESPFDLKNLKSNGEPIRFEKVEKKSKSNGEPIRFEKVEKKIEIEWRAHSIWKSLKKIFWLFWKNHMDGLSRARWSRICNRIRKTPNGWRVTEVAQLAQPFEFSRFSMANHYIGTALEKIFYTFSKKPSGWTKSSALSSKKRPVQTSGKALFEIFWKKQFRHQELRLIEIFRNRMDSPFDLKKLKKQNRNRMENPFEMGRSTVWVFKVFVLELL